MGSEEVEVATSRRTIIIGCSGSVACIKIPEIAWLLCKRFPLHRLLIVPTFRGRQLIPLTHNGLLDFHAVGLESASSAQEEPIEILDPNNIIPLAEVQNIAEVADAFLISPLGANLMANLASGEIFTESGRMSNLGRILKAFLRHRRGKKCPLLVAPAMNPVMWNSIITKRHLQQLERQYGEDLIMLPTVCKTVMCGEIGFGGMQSPSNIVEALQQAFQRKLFPRTNDDVPRILPPLFQKMIPPYAVSAVQKEEFQFTCQTGFSYAECLSRVAAVHTGERIVKTPMNVLLAGSPKSGSLFSVFCEDLSRLLTGPMQIKMILGKTDATSHDSVAPDSQLNLHDQLEFTDEMEWQCWKKRGDPVLHIWLRQWASILVLISPEISVLRKIINGYCDDLLTCTVRAWNFQNAGAFILLHWNDPALFFECQELFNALSELGFAICSR